MRTLSGSTPWPSGMRVPDPTADFQALIVPHLADAVALAGWLTKHRPDADDVVQEACLRAFRSIGTFRGGNPRAWLLAIVRNVAFSFLQRDRLRNAVSIESLGDGDLGLLEHGGDG